MWRLILIAAFIAALPLAASAGIGFRQSSSGSFALPVGEYTGTITTTADFAAMPQGSWAAIANSKMQDVQPSPTPPGITGPRSVTDTWGDCVMDNVGNRVFCWGGGHADYGGNEVYEFDFDTLSWSLFWGPTPNEDIVVCPTLCETNDDGTPTSRHTYHGLAIDPGTNSLLSYGGGPWGNQGGFTLATWKLDLTTKTWTQLTNAGQGWAIYYPPTQQVITGTENAQIVKWHTVSTDTFTQGIGTNTVALYDRSPALDVENDIIVIFGWGDVLHLDPSDLSFSTPSTTGCAGEFPAVPGVSYDPALERVLVYEGEGETSVWKYDATTNTCSEMTVSGGNLYTPAINPEAHFGIYGRFFYVASIQRHCFVSFYKGNVECYRPVGGA